MKCLEKDRTRRYETANGLAQDIERHLNHEPVDGAPAERGLPGAEVRAAEQGDGWRRRPRSLLRWLLGMVVSTWQAVRATRAEKQASTVADFLEDMLNSVRPEEAKGRDNFY